MEILCFFAGIACVYIHPLYPLAIPVIAFLFRPHARFVLWLVVAIAYALMHGFYIHESGMPKTSVVKNMTIEGVVSSIPVQSSSRLQFAFDITRFNNELASSKVLLNCYNNCPEIHAGELWRFQAKLKRPRNYGNPGYFDYVRFLKAKHIHWSGYVRKGGMRISDDRYFPLLRLRAYLAESLYKLHLDEQTIGITQALTLGVTNHIDKSEWDLFRRTGTIHLMVISGAHIGLVAGLCFILFKWLWCRSSRLCLYLPAQRAASLFALTMALLYSLCAGFGVPAERALIVCFFMLLSNFTHQRFSVWQAWRYALLAVLLFEPHSVLMPGFYLSFLAVATLLISNQRFKSKGIKQTLTMQLACLIGLMPFTLYWFSYGAVNGLIANLIAVPWVGFVVIPLALLTILMIHWVTIPWLIGLLHLSITGLMHFLSWIDTLSMVNLQFSFPSLLQPIGLIVAICMLIFMPYRAFTLLSILLGTLCFFPKYETVREGEAVVDVLDVGQGLAVVVRTANHQVIYDTGVRFYQGSDMGKMVIIPFLETLGVKFIDKIIVSHSDLDHRGGIESLEEAYSIGELIVDDPSFYKRGTGCHQHPSWEYDGISFKFFPLPVSLKGKNNHSCVLQVKSSSAQILLTGDIEKGAEQYLLKHYGAALQSNILLIPHHGSKTSSSRRFVHVVRPTYAIYSYGFDNRYRFPHVATQKTYKDLGVTTLNTVDCGKVRFKLATSMETPPACYRVM
jgi:competence protein ComEC